MSQGTSGSRPGPYRAIICDLDGVVYRGGMACPGAVEGLTAARAAGIRVLYLTNNAGHRPEEVEERLRGLGLPVAPGEVITSSMVAAAHVATLTPPREDAVTLAVGGPGVRLCLERAGVSTLSPADLSDGHGPQVWAVVQGYGAQLTVSDLNEAAYAINDGALWVATNADSTLPTERGLAPGNGSMLAAVGHGTGRTPDLVVGKPERPAFQRCLEVLDLAPEEVLTIGDRLDTDIAGARAVGIPTALVLTGVHGRGDVEAAAPEHRPDIIVDTIPDLGLVAGG